MPDKKNDGKTTRRYVQGSFDGMPAIAPRQQQEQPREASQGDSSDGQQTPPDPDDK